MPVHKLLTKEQVVAEAIALIEESGPAAFSVRRLADRLGVSATTILWHARSRDQLLRDVAHAVMASIELPDGEELSPEDWLRLAAAAIRRALLDRPRLLPVVRDYMALAAATTELIVSIAQAFERAGYRGSVLRTACDAYEGYVFGYNLLQHAQLAATTSPEIHADLTRHAHELADRVSSPAIAELLRGENLLGRETVEQALDRDYTEGLEALLEGLRRRLRPAPARSPRRRTHPGRHG